jgi:hypothetical protein
MSVDPVITVIEDCAEYADIQFELKNLMSSGFFLLAKSRKNVSRISIEDCRADLDANYRVDSTTGGEFTEWVSKPQTDPLLLLAALPPRDLRHSQEAFKKSLGKIVEAATKINSIRNNLELQRSSVQLSESRLE